MEANEIWKPIDGYNYKVSNTGKVLSVKRNIVLKPHSNVGNGLPQVMLWNNAHCKLHYVHRLVALAFVENPNNYRYVKHHDNDYNNNNADNLYWSEQINPKSNA